MLRRARLVADDNTIRVSLGRPEPLPGVGLAPGVDGQAGVDGRHGLAVEGRQGRADSPTASPISPARADRPRHREPEPTRPAHRPRSRRPRRTGKRSCRGPRPSSTRLQTYQMRVSRLERVGGQLQPEEEILLSIRRDPKAVRLEWASGPSKGREVIYSSALDPRMIFVHMPPTAIPLPVMKIPVDSPLVMRNSRHAITEAGLDTIVENLRKSERGGDDAASQRGRAQLSRASRSRRASTGPATISCAGRRPAKPGMSTSTSARCCRRMVVAQDSRGEMIERYVYREIRENPTDLAVAGAFEPDQRWGESKGLLGRLARAAAGANLPAPDASTTR